MSLSRIVHALERHRPGRAYAVELAVHRPVLRAPAVLASQRRIDGYGARAIVLGTGERVDVAVGGAAEPLPGNMASNAPEGLLPRHLGVLSLPLPSGVLFRVFSLHPERGFTVLPVGGEMPTADGLESMAAATGSVWAWNAIRVALGSYVVDISAVGCGAPDVVDATPTGEQLAFQATGVRKGLAGAMASIAGPAREGGGGGHAIPALVVPDEIAGDGALQLRTKNGLMRVVLSGTDLMRGVLIGRSRRCVLGPGFDENDGLSRVHALVAAIDAPGMSGVFAFDLASRYGIRDVSRPTRLLPVSRIDDGIGCLVYGAGYLTWEPSW